MSDIKNAQKGILFGILYNIIGILFPFITRTVIIYKLGVTYVGLGSLFTSILQVLSLSELGVGAAITYTLYKPISERNVNKVNEILHFYKHIYFCIGIIIIIISLVIFPFLDCLIKSDIPYNININFLYLVYVLNTVVSYFFFAYRKVLFSANRRYDIEVKINSIIMVVQYLVQIIMLFLFSNYYIYVITILVMTFANNIISYIVSKIKYPEYKSDGKLGKNETKEIVMLTAGSFLAKIGTTIYLSVDSIVISAFLGLSVLGIYNNYYYVISSLIAVFAIIHNTMRPIIGKRLIVDERNETWKQFKNFNTLYMCLVIFCCSCMYSLYQDFEYMWCGKENLLNPSIVFLFIIYFYTGRCYSVLELYQESAGLMWKGKYFPLISAIINLIINIVLVQHIGLYGILISSILASVVISLPGYIHITFNNLFLKRDRKEYFGELLKNTAQVVLICFICKCISKNIIVESWSVFFAKSLIVACISAVLVIVMNCKNDVFRDIKLYLKYSR